MTRYFFGSAAAVLCAGALVAAQAPADQQSPSQPPSGAQSPAPAPTQAPTQQPQTQTRTPTQASAAASTTVTGCVYREADVPGRTPNVAERAGVLEDYILADVRMSPAGAGAATGTSGAGGAAGAIGSAGAGGAPTTGGAAATTGSSSASMYKLELVDDDKLQALVGKRVEVTGRIDRESGDAAPRPQGTTGVGGGAAAGGAGATSTGAPGAVSGNPGSAGNDPGATGNTRAGAGAAGAAGGQAGAQADRSIGPDRIELPEFEVTSIREMAGTCPATPAGR